TLAAEKCIHPHFAAADFTSEHWPGSVPLHAPRAAAALLRFDARLIQHLLHQLHIILLRLGEISTANRKRLQAALLHICARGGRTECFAHHSTQLLQYIGRRLCSSINAEPYAD